MTEQLDGAWEQRLRAAVDGGGQVAVEDAAAALGALDAARQAERAFEGDASDGQYALEGVVRQARHAVEAWEQLRGTTVGSLGDLISPAGWLVDLSNALLHLGHHLADLDRAADVARSNNVMAQHS